MGKKSLSKNTLSDNISVDKTAENLTGWRKFCPPNCYVRRNILLVEIQNKPNKYEIHGGGRALSLLPSSKWWLPQEKKTCVRTPFYWTQIGTLFGTTIELNKRQQYLVKKVNIIEWPKMSEIVGKWQKIFRKRRKMLGWRRRPSFYCESSWNMHSVTHGAYLIIRMYGRIIPSLEYQGWTKRLNPYKNMKGPWESTTPPHNYICHTRFFVRNLSTHSL